MQPQIINITNNVLKGLLYSKNNRNVIVCIHGAGMNSMIGASAFVPNLFQLYDSYDIFSVDLRSHEIAYNMGSYNQFGGWAYQKIEDNLKDIDDIIKYLLEVGYNKVYLCGHSWGGLVCTHYVYENRNKHNVAGMILLSPTESYRLLLEVNYRERVEMVVEQARYLVESGEPHKTIETENGMLIPFWSAMTVLDFSNSTFSLSEKLPALDIDTLFMVGGREHKLLLQTGKKLSDENRSIVFNKIKNANHFYSGCEHEVVSRLEDFLIEMEQH